MRRVVEEGYDAVAARVRELLKAEGFGVLTEIDVQKTLKEKLGVGFRRYEILGACHPPSAFAVLTADPEIGLLLPCNVVVYEIDAARTQVSIFDPMQIAAGSNDPVIRETAADVRARLDRVLERISAK
jgi:uncharacterized protein (DUF302 family)